jgi:hypothetical protein
MCVQHIARIVTVNVLEDVRKSPIEWKYAPVVIALVIPALPPVHVVLPEIRHKKATDFTD